MHQLASGLQWTLNPGARALETLKAASSPEDGPDSQTPKATLRSTTLRSTTLGSTTLCVLHEKMLQLPSGKVQPDSRTPVCHFDCTPSSNNPSRLGGRHRDSQPASPGGRAVRTCIEILRARTVKTPPLVAPPFPGKVASKKDATYFQLARILPSDSV